MGTITPRKWFKTKLTFEEVIRQEEAMKQKEVVKRANDQWESMWPHKDIEVKEPEYKELKGWTVTETIGLGVANPSTMMMGVDYGYPVPKELTEEEKEIRRIENKGW